MTPKPKRARRWTVTSWRPRPPYRWWHNISLGVHIDLRHPMMHLHLLALEVRIGRHYIVDGGLCANDPDEWHELVES
jgi:hypothetical protein